jgi:chorismate mutase
MVDFIAFYYKRKKCLRCEYFVNSVIENGIAFYIGLCYHYTVQIHMCATCGHWVWGNTMVKDSVYLLVDSSVLPEVFLKVMEAKSILAKEATKTVNDAVKQAGISRSAFYKYRDFVFPFYETSRGRVVTLFFVVEDFAGILSKIINIIAQAKANIVTINQNIPINGLADVTISIQTSEMSDSIEKLTGLISGIEGVRRFEILARE